VGPCLDIAADSEPKLYHYAGCWRARADSWQSESHEPCIYTSTLMSSLNKSPIRAAVLCRHHTPVGPGSPGRMVYRLESDVNPRGNALVIHLENGSAQSSTSEVNLPEPSIIWVTLSVDPSELWGAVETLKLVVRSVNRGLGCKLIYRIRTGAEKREGKSLKHAGNQQCGE